MVRYVRQYGRDFRSEQTVTRIYMDNWLARCKAETWTRPGHRRVPVFSDREETVNGQSAVLNRARSPVITPGTMSWFLRFGKLYCRMFHRSISTPVNGRYRCWKCLREFDLEW